MAFNAGSAGVSGSNRRSEMHADQRKSAANFTLSPDGDL